MQVVAGAFERAAVGYRADRRSLFLPTFMRDERFAEDSFKGFSSTSFARSSKWQRKFPSSAPAISALQRKRTATWRKRAGNL